MTKRSTRTGRPPQLRAHRAHPQQPQDWRELARAYRHMIKRWRFSACRQASVPACPVARFGRISRVRQADLAAAAAALEVCVSLAPEDNKQREALVEVYEAQGAGGFAGGSQAREQLLAAASDAEGAAQQIRALAGLYGEHQRYDGASVPVPRFAH